MSMAFARVGSSMCLQQAQWTGIEPVPSSASTGKPKRLQQKQCQARGMPVQEVTTVLPDMAAGG